MKCLSLRFFQKILKFSKILNAKVFAKMERRDCVCDLMSLVFDVCVGTLIGAVPLLHEKVSMIEMLKKN